MDQNKNMTEKYLLCAIFTSADKAAECELSLAELSELVKTASEYECEIYTVTQCRKTPDCSMYIGEGKAKEAAQICLNNDIDVVVVNGELSPSQIRNLEDKIVGFGAEKVRVIDRTMLILDIFAKHAVTSEGKVQVEIAQLRYTSPRLTGKGIALSRQGGTSGSVGARGPGETKLETDKRHIKRRIEALESELCDMCAEREIKRVKRIKQNIPTVSIVGYTNAGKSTLLNFLTGAGILAENKLFATLDPTTRKLELPSGKEVLLTDTVGFINDLPHKLVEAFHSTLEEAKYADLLLIVTDISDENHKEKLAVTERTLEDLGIGEKPRLYVFNKCDRLENIPENDIENRTVYISAENGIGMDRLLCAVEKALDEGMREVTFMFPFDMSSAVNRLYKSAKILSSEYTERGTLVRATVDAKLYGMYKEYVTEK